MDHLTYMVLLCIGTCCTARVYLESGSVPMRTLTASVGDAASIKIFTKLLNTVDRLENSFNDLADKIESSLNKKMEIMSKRLLTAVHDACTHHKTNTSKSGSQDLSFERLRGNWTTTKFACIRENNIKVIDDISMEACQTLCESTHGCCSVDYMISVGSCRLQAVNKVTASQTYYSEPCYATPNDLLYTERVTPSCPQTD